MTRMGPKPLPFQLGMASLASAGLAGGTAFTPQQLQDFFKGIQKYQQHPFKRPDLPAEITWHAGEVRLKRAPGNPRYGMPVVLIPSMVNRSDILDLLPDRSFLRFLAQEGFDAYLLDWGNPTEDEGLASLDKVMSERLIPALESIGGPVMLLGYCMGGLLSAAAAALRPDLVRACALLATPWNFHDEKAALKARMSLMKPMALPYMKQYARLPESWMQAVFATLDPEGSIRKFASFANLADGDEREEAFIAVEDWLNEGLDLPAAVAMSCMEEWYEENRPESGTWQVCSAPVIAKDIKVPTMVIAATDDRIVPIDSAVAFAEQRLKCERLVCKTGHVGLIAGSRAKQEVWQPIAGWFALQQ